MNYLTPFQSHSYYEEAKDSLILPNVSYCKEENEVHFNQKPSTKIVAKFVVNDASVGTRIIGYTEQAQIEGPTIRFDNFSSFSDIEIDGQTMMIRDATPRLSVGVHTIKYTPSNLSTINYNDFRECNRMVSVEFPSNITTIDSYAFAGCTNLSSLTLTENITTLNSGAFNNCISLRSVYIPSGVTNIYGNPFTGCYNIEAMSVDGNNEAYFDDTHNAIISVDGTLVSGCKNTSFNSGYTSLTSIGPDAFAGCSSLQSFVIPNYVESIKDRAFANCTSLSSLTIGNNVSDMRASYVFNGCSRLTNIYAEPLTAPTVVNATFRNIASNGTLTIYEGSTGYNTWLGTGNYYLGKYGWNQTYFIGK